MISSMTISQALRTPAGLRSSEGQTPPLSQALCAAFHLQPKRNRKGASTFSCVNRTYQGSFCIPIHKFSLRSLRLNFQAIAT